MPVRDVAARPHADLASVGVVLSLSRYRQNSYLCMCKLSWICPRDQWLPDGRAECTIYRSCRVSCQLVRLGTALRNSRQVLSRLRRIGRITFARRSWWVGGRITPAMLCYSEMRRLLPGWIEKALAMHAYLVGQDFCETPIGLQVGLLHVGLAWFIASHQVTNQISRDSTRHNSCNSDSDSVFLKSAECNVALWFPTSSPRPTFTTSAQHFALIW